MEVYKLKQSQIPHQHRPIQQPQEVAHRQRGSEIGNAQGRDEGILSEQGQFLQRIYQAAIEAADVRENKVSELQRRIAEGSYRVPVFQLVDRLLGVNDAR